jgi:chemotaxis protein CheD
VIQALRDGAPARPVHRGTPDHGERASAYLHGGQVAVAAQPTAITTVLGSCVAVCLYDPVARVGGMNHFLLPHHVERERSPRFGTVAVPQLLEGLLGAGAHHGHVKAKVFGGSSVLSAFRHRNLGDENAELALRLLADAGVEVVERDLGGQRGRKLIFHTDDGTAWVRHL